MTDSNRPDKSPQRLLQPKANQLLSLILAKSALRCPYPIQLLSRFLFRGFRDDFFAVCISEPYGRRMRPKMSKIRSLLETTSVASAVLRILRYLRLPRLSTFSLPTLRRFRLSEFDFSSSDIPKIL